MGADKKLEKKHFLDQWFTAHGEHREDSYIHRCQSCGRSLWRWGADPSHKIPAGRGGDVGGHVQPENVIASCRPCHVWLETSKDAEFARIHIILDKANLTNDLLVDWTPELWQSLKRHLFKNFGKPPRALPTTSND